MASKSSLVAGMLLRALGLRMSAVKASPLTALHIPGKHNRIADVPSRSFGYKAEWHCKTDTEFLNLFNSLFPLKNQESWHLFTLHNNICMRVISILLMKVSGLQEWRRLPKIGISTGGTGNATANLWEWICTLTQDRQDSQQKSEQSVGLQPEQESATMGEENVLPWALSVRRSRPLARRSQWTQEPTHSKLQEPTNSCLR